MDLPLRICLTGPFSKLPFGDIASIYLDELRYQAPIPKCRYLMACPTFPQPQKSLAGKNSRLPEGAFAYFKNLDLSGY